MPPFAAVSDIDLFILYRVASRFFQCQANFGEIGILEIYFYGKCFLFCVLFLVMEIFYCKKIELKTFDCM